MRQRTKRFGLVIGTLGVLALLAGCSSSSSRDSITQARHDRNSDQQPGTYDVRFQAHVEQVGPDDAIGPFAEGHRSYEYYPSSEVYFDVDRSLYFWQTTANQWTSGDRLPTSIRLNQRERTTIRLSTAYPTRFHTSVRMTYPAGGMMTSVEASH